MAKAAMPGSLTSIKRKTPSELRNEQLKRKCSVEVGDESVGHFVASTEDKNTSVMVHGRKKLEALKNTKYVDTRLDEVYPARKSNVLRKHTGGNVKQDNYSREQKSPSVRSDLADKSLPQVSCSNDSVVTAAATDKDNTVKSQSSQATEKCNHNTFRNVAVLSKGNENSCGQPTLDMNSVLKGLGVREAPTTSQSLAESSDQLKDLQFANSGKFRSNFRISGHKTPIDLTLKSSMRLVSSSSVKWCHRLITNSTFYGITQFMPQIGCTGNQNHCNTLESTTTAEVLFSKALHSWVFPQSSLPPSAISALNLTSSRG
ncbi:hypothetical protein MKW94_002745, partial [Papaver nudicaule]|nr:hypothetical protein [Papaver nudicaule]